MGKAAQEFLINEIQSMIKEKEQIREAIVFIVKIYISLFLALFAYTGFFQKVIVVQTNQSSLGDPYSPERVFALLGAFLLFAILYYGYYGTRSISNLLKKRIILSRQIAKLRGFAIAKKVGGIYKGVYIVPTSENDVNWRHHEPIAKIYTIIGMLLPTGFYYYFYYIFGQNTLFASTATVGMMVIGIFLIPNICVLHYRDLQIAVSTNSDTNEMKAKENYESARRTKSDRYKKKISKKKYIPITLLITTQFFKFILPDTIVISFLRTSHMFLILDVLSLLYLALLRIADVYIQTGNIQNRIVKMFINGR